MSGNDLEKGHVVRRAWGAAASGSLRSSIECQSHFLARALYSTTVGLLLFVVDCDHAHKLHGIVENLQGVAAVPASEQRYRRVVERDRGLVVTLQTLQGIASCRRYRTFFASRSVKRRRQRHGQWCTDSAFRFEQRMGKGETKIGRQPNFDGGQERNLVARYSYPKPRRFSNEGIIVESYHSCFWLVQFLLVGSTRLTIQNCL
jgi:hypothetical protein